MSSHVPDGILEPEKWLKDQNSEANTETQQLLLNPLLKKDVWRTIEDLGLELNQHHKILTINFQLIKINWFKLLIKLYILVKSQQNISPNSLKNEVLYLNKFSKFLTQASVLYPEQINEKIFEDFDNYLKSSKLSQSYIVCIYATLASFFVLCRQEGWLNVDTYWFKGKCKKPRPKNDKIEYIPEEIWQQLDQHLHHLPEEIQRMPLIIRRTGLRIGELLNLPFDCLRKRETKWRLRFLTEKYKTEDEIPICTDLVLIIEEQQEYIFNHFQGRYNYLFGSSNSGPSYQPTPRVMCTSTFNNWLNKLAQKHNICTKDGQIWRFRSHQFRRTVATVMTNTGIRDLIIQKYLRHRSPDMLNHYAHLLKKVLGQEAQDLIKDSNYVDITGTLVTTHKPKSSMTEIIRRKMYQITTQYGECHRPILKSPCQTVNACLRCEHWRTSNDDLDYLKEDLNRIKTEIKTAGEFGLARQKKELIKDQQHLINCLQALEKINDKN